MKEKKDWGMYRIIISCVLAQVILLFAKVVGMTSAEWGYVFAPSIIMWVGIILYMGLSLLLTKPQNKK